jgi:hypothetical protein
MKCFAGKWFVQSQVLARSGEQPAEVQVKAIGIKSRLGLDHVFGFEFFCIFCE